MKPIIALTTDLVTDTRRPEGPPKLNLAWEYSQAISEAGGNPVVLTPQTEVEPLLEWIDGWVIPGGDDIDACRWGEPNHPQAILQRPERFEWEERIFRAAPAELPILGICYGCQFLNVVMGGSLVQHLPDEVGHGNHSGGTWESFSPDPESKLSEVVGGGEIRGRSYHHQSIRAVAPGLEVVARHEDGTVEAVESRLRPWLLGVQWHPERSCDHEANRKLFASLVDAARGYSVGKAVRRGAV